MNAIRQRLQSFHKFIEADDPVETERRYIVLGLGAAGLGLVATAAITGERIDPVNPNQQVTPIVVEAPADGQPEPLPPIEQISENNQ